ncbi:Dabb family protein [Amycolatopsis jiangsuensis]|uniref:Stress-response A/B barrel domain-containing protein n=1 Tax=Amycolatopsis jiangsuensis TaxID=1181879 RepID=A0A840J3B9_9PSEU|nr:Dabb family protein [Amycolatopsis jiangsuensis]MBB4689566.1 hypothetical protein [Amycolatopsis jiangsuensis]
MFRHVFLLTVQPSASPAEIERLITELRALPERISEIRRYEVVPDAGFQDGNAALMLIADFDSFGDYETYRDHPEHLGLIAECVKPISAGFSRLQFHLDDERPQLP